MLSALQLHRKTIKFQKPDTTQDGITFKARYCLLFSVLNKILRVGASGWFIMNRDSVHMIVSSTGKGKYIPRRPKLCAMACADSFT